jgi:acyl-CoA thioester hydrolase
MRKKRGLNEAALVHRESVKVRFSEVDSMNIVWHGNYIKFFEDGREAFGKRYGIGYLDIYRAGYTAPVVELHCNYMKSITYGETAVVETKFIFLPAAKIRFEYDIYRESDNTLVATGYSLQVFLNNEGELEWNKPAFYIEWQRKWKLIE